MYREAIDRGVGSAGLPEEDNEMAKETKEITIRCKAFSGEGVRTHRVMVDEDGTVRVWDSVAGHYTVCHSLSPRSQRRIARLAAEA